MQIEFSEISPSQRYHLLTQTVIPRPIAWVLSQNDDDSLNLAPFSFFNAICSDPPLLVMSIGKKEAGERKDTAINLLSGRDFVVHIAGVRHAEALTQSAATLDYGDSELSLTGLSLEDFPGCPLPRLKDCDIAYHCRLYDHHFVGPNQQAVIYGEIIQLQVNDEVVQQQGKRLSIDANKISPLSRLGAAQYAPIAQAFSINRPK